LHAGGRRFDSDILHTGRAKTPISIGEEPRIKTYNVLIEVLDKEKREKRLQKVLDPDSWILVLTKEFIDILEDCSKEALRLIL
jgi:hypothetical protein